MYIYALYFSRGHISIRMFIKDSNTKSKKPPNSILVSNLPNESFLPYYSGLDKRLESDF